MTITQALLDDLTTLAKASPQLRMNYDLRNSAADQSQRMLNAIEPDSVIPIHRHNETSETVICIRGAVEEVFFDAEGTVLESHVLRYGSECCSIQVPRGVYHTCRCLEPGSVIFEAKDRAYDPARTEDMLSI